MRRPSRRLAALLCLALLGIAVALGLVVSALAGVVGVLAYAAGAVLLLGVAVAKGRALWRPPALPPGRTCTCCTTSQHDPVKVI